ncbi:MAG: response regulator transcription factor [Planctomycetota bacterium]|nr:response regulator transcription factor [Planctomycetota bacterium]
MSIKVLIADDHEVVRQGLACLLKGTDIEIVAEADTGDKVVELARAHHPDVVLLDIRMPQGDGLTALELIRDELPATRVVMLSTYDNPTYVARAVALGASDYVLKGCSREDLITAITAAAAGEAPSKGGEMRRISGTMATREQTGDSDVPLTQRELQVLRHIALGLSNKEIGRSLTISVETVKEHVQNVLRKIAVTDRTQAAVWAVRKGLV